MYALPQDTVNIVDIVTSRIKWIGKLITNRKDEGTRIMAKGGRRSNSVHVIDLRGDVVREDYVLSMSCYDDYFRSIRMDDERLFKMALAVGNTDALLNGVFNFSYGKWRSFVRSSVDRPFCVAAVYRSLTVMGLMLKLGAKVRLQTTSGRNVLHVITQAAANDQSIEEELIDVCKFLASRLNSQDWKALLEAEDANGMRPLEYAARKGALGVFHQIFRTSTNIMEVTRLGTNLVLSYDLTEYESFNRGHRHGRSPLLSLARMKKGKESNIYASKMFADPTLALWIRNKVICNVPALFVWFMLRSAYVFLIMYSWFGVYGLGAAEGTENEYEEDGGVDANATDFLPLLLPDCTTHCESSPFTKGAVMTITLILSAISLLVDFIEAVIVLWNYCRPQRKYFVRTPVAMGSLSTALCYRTGHFCLTLCVPVFYLYLSRARREILTPNQVYSLSGVLVASALFVSMSVGYFVQLFPIIGHMQMLCGRLVILVLRFLCIFLIYVAIFGLVLGSLLSLYATGGETNMERTSYATLTVLLNQFEPYELGDNGRNVLIFLRVALLVVTTLLLLNFSIGIVSNAVTSLVPVLHVVKSVEHLNAAFLVETRLSWLTSKLYSLLQPMVYSVEHGHVILNVLTPDAGLPKDFVSWVYK